MVEINLLPLNVLVSKFVTYIVSFIFSFYFLSLILFYFFICQFSVTLVALALYLVSSVFYHL